MPTATPATTSKLFSSHSSPALKQPRDLHLDQKQTNVKEEKISDYINNNSKIDNNQWNWGKHIEKQKQRGPFCLNVPLLPY
jgi:hypothetical protein